MNVCFDEINTCFECFYHFDQGSPLKEDIDPDWEEPSIFECHPKHSKDRLNDRACDDLPLYLRIEIPWSAIKTQAISCEISK